VSCGSSIIIASANIETFSTCLQLIVTFAVALKHRLRFEPFIDYDDMRNNVEFLDTVAKGASVGVDTTPRKQSMWRRVGSFLGLSIAQSDPRERVKQTTKPLGNLPLEILTHIQGFINTVADNGTLKTPVFSAPLVNGVTTLNDVLTGTERILNTPLPIAYRIVISQITWIYVLSLPIQLFKLEWKMIPVTLVASYIILGLELIGSQIEDPFGFDVNDLHLDSFCEQIAHDIDVIASTPAPLPEEYAKRGLNKPLWPLSKSGYDVWMKRSEEQIREALKMKVEIRHDSCKIQSGAEEQKESKA
jgi:ion channel-forming bestrophin family protein